MRHFCHHILKVIGNKSDSEGNKKVEKKTYWPSLPKNVLDKLGNFICLAVKERVPIGKVPKIHNQSIDLAIALSYL